MSEVPSRAAGAKYDAHQRLTFDGVASGELEAVGPMEYAVSQLVERRERNDDGCLKRHPPRPDDVAGTH